MSLLNKSDCPTWSPQCLPPRHRRKMFRQTTGFSPSPGRFVQDSCLEDYGGYGCSLFIENMILVLQYYSEGEGGWIGKV